MYSTNFNNTYAPKQLNGLGEPVTIALAVTKGIALFAKLKPVAKAIAAVANFAGKLGIGGVTQDRFLARRDWLAQIFESAGYKRVAPAPTMGGFKILAADIPNKLTDRTYAAYFERLRKFAVATLNFYNPGLGDLYAASFPTWPMANGGNIYSEPINVIAEIVKTFPPGTFNPQIGYQIQTAVAKLPDGPLPVINNPDGTTPAQQQAQQAYTFVRDAAGTVIQVRDAYGQIVNPGTPQYNQAVQNQNLAPQQAGIGTVGKIVIGAIGLSALVYIGSQMGDASKKKTLSGTTKPRRKKFNDIVRDGISYNKKQIKKLETEIEKFQKGKKGATQAQKDKIDEIIKWDRKLISDFRAEISSLKKRL